MKYFVFVVLLILLAACSSQSVQDDLTSTKSDEVLEPQLLKDLDASVFEGACVMVKDGVRSELSFKDGLVRFDNPSIGGHAVYTREVLFIWVGDSGTSIRVDESQNLGKVKSKEQLIDDAISNEAMCTAQSLGEDLFTPPASVDFVDLTDVLKEKVSE